MKYIFFTFLLFPFLCLGKTTGASSKEMSLLYFAADEPLINNSSNEVPPCYQFEVENIQDRLEEQLVRLKNKYSSLFDYKIEKTSNGHTTLHAKARNHEDKIIEFYYTTDPIACNIFQQNKSSSAGGNDSEEDSQLKTENNKPDPLAPVKCSVEIDNRINKINCSVLTDFAIVNNVILNRGRCEPLVASQEDKALFEEYLKKIEKNLRNLKNMNDIALAYAMSYEIAGRMMELSIKAKKSPEEEALIRAFVYPLDPRGHYNFSDKFAIAFPASCNLLEYSIEINSNTYIWTVQ